MGQMLPDGLPKSGRALSVDNPRLVNAIGQGLVKEMVNALKGPLAELP